MNRPGIVSIINKSLFVAVFLCVSLSALCQQNNATAVSRNTLYGGFDFKDMYYSVNYDHIFIRMENSVTVTASGCLF